MLYKSMFCKSSPVQSSPVQSIFYKSLFYKSSPVHDLQIQSMFYKSNPVHVLQYDIVIKKKMPPVLANQHSVILSRMWWQLRSEKAYNSCLIWICFTLCISPPQHREHATFNIENFAYIDHEKRLLSDRSHWTSGYAVWTREKGELQITGPVLVY